MLERLQKIIARTGIASRRHAEQLMLSGQVVVNGQVITELGSKADPERDRIEVAGKLVRFPESKIYLMLDKPPQVVSTMADPEGRRSLRNFLTGIPGRVFPVGRLDYSASGLVLLTSDGDLANRILKAAARLPQTYWIKVRGRLSGDQIRRLEQELRGRVHPLKSPHAAGSHAANPWYEVTLSEARRDLLRKSLTMLGHPVEKLKRVKLASLELAGLPEGRYRHLEAEEVAALKRALARSSPASLIGGKAKKPPSESALRRGGRAQRNVGRNARTSAHS